MDTPISSFWLPATLEALLLILAGLSAVVWLLLIRVKSGAVRARRLLAMSCAATLCMLLGRTWFVEPFHVPSASMVPTLLVGDFLLVQNFPYQLSWPISGNRLVKTGDPVRGDVVVFTLADRPDFRLVKRVIGLPGDEVVQANGRWFVNGKELAEATLGTYEDPRSGPDSLGRPIRQETLAGRRFNVLQGGPLETAHYWKVPEGKLFVMGDNRGLSRDSRDFGFVERGRVVGRVARVLFNATGWDRWALPLGGDNPPVSH